MLKSSATLMLLLFSPLLSPNPWPDRAKADLREIHDVITVNHPGPVDTSNPSFRKWLDNGLTEALTRADHVDDEEGFRDVLRFYTNGFRDDHLNLKFDTVPQDVWPGFLTTTDTRGVTRVATTSADLSVLQGAVLKSCDGQSAARLLEERVYSLKSNPDVPSTRTWHSPELLIVPSGTPREQFRPCTLSTPHGEITTKLRWRPLSDQGEQLHLA